MSTTEKLGQAIESLEAALQVAEKERDQGVFQVARGVRSHGELMRLAERVALVRSLVVQARTLLPTDEAPQRHGQFRPGEHWQRGRVLYRVEPCPLIPSCVRLMPVANRSSPRSTAIGSTPSVSRGSAHDPYPRQAPATASADRQPQKDDRHEQRHL